MNDFYESPDFFKVILSSITDGVFTVNSERIITSFNSAAEKITRIPASQAIGKHCQDVFNSDICENCLLQDTLKTELEIIDIPVNIINSLGEKVPISISTAVLKDEDGSTLGVVETFRDLSAIKHLRKELGRSYSLEDIAESECTILIHGPSGS